MVLVLLVLLLLGIDYYLFEAASASFFSWALYNSAALELYFVSLNFPSLLYIDNYNNQNNKNNRKSN